MKWIGPYKTDELLDGMMTDSHPKPPPANSVYVISQRSWQDAPTFECIPLYVGSNTSTSQRFRTRVGDLIADMFGFFTTETGHHSGGQSLHQFCKEHGVNPRNLYIGWVQHCECPRCLENKVYNGLKPRLNRNKPAKCKKH